MFLAAAILSVFALETAADAPLGSAAFVPSTERPVGWRGDGSGRFPGATPPMKWERKRNGSGYATQNILWAAQLPNTALSSPVIAGDRVFVTAGFTDVVCIDKKSGRILWIRSNPEFQCVSDEDRKASPIYAELDSKAEELAKVNTEIVEALNARLESAATSAYAKLPAFTKKRAIEKEIRDKQFAIDKKKFTADWPQVIYGFCTETPATDGKHVCALFGTGVAVCYDLDGKRKWIARGSIGGEEKGHYSSPIIMGNQFVVWGDPEMRAYDVETGKVLWRNAAKGSNCGSLYRLRVGGELVVGLQTTYFVRLADGQRIWNGPDLKYSFTTAIAEKDTIFAWPGGPNKDFKSYSIPANTTGGPPILKTTFKKPEWAADELVGKFDKGDLNASPLFLDGLIYHLYVGGGLAVHDAATGEVVYRKILPLKPRVEYWAWGGASASPALGGKHIFLWDNQGMTAIIEPGREYKEVAVNRIEESLDNAAQDQNLASPVFEGARIYYRTPGYLYCIGEK